MAKGTFGEIIEAPPAAQTNVGQLGGVQSPGAGLELKSVSVSGSGPTASFGKAVTPEEKAKALRLERNKFTKDLRFEYNNRAVVKNTQLMRAAVGRMVAVWNNFAKDPESIASKNALDQALVITFNKMLDPGSVVRESEFARTPEGEGLVSKFKGRIKQVTEGGVGLTDPAREELVKTAVLMMEAQNRQAVDEQDFFIKEAEFGGLDPKRVVRIPRKLPTMVSFISRGEENPIIQQLRKRGASEEQIKIVEEQLKAKAGAK